MRDVKHTETLVKDDEAVILAVGKIKFALECLNFKCSEKNVIIRIGTREISFICLFFIYVYLFDNLE